MEVSLSNGFLTIAFGKIIFVLPLTWIIFGSATSIDCDVIIFISEAVVENISANDCKKICFELDKLLGPIIGTSKKVNSSLGCWVDGQLVWCQKGSTLNEVNNSIIATFANHTQMYSVCPINRFLSRDILAKVQSAIRATLNKLSASITKSCDDLLPIIIGALCIPEVRDLASKNLKEILDTIFRGVTFDKPVCARICITVPDASNHIANLEKSLTRRNKKVKEILANISNGLPTDILVREILDLNTDEIVSANAIVALLEKYLAVAPDDNESQIDQVEQKEQKDQKDQKDQKKKKAVTRLTKTELPDFVAALKKKIDSDTIALHRVISKVTGVNQIGVRMDMIRMINFHRIILTEEPFDRMKEAAFQLGQLAGLLGVHAKTIDDRDKEAFAAKLGLTSTQMADKYNSVIDLGLNPNDVMELYDKADIATAYPDLAVFLFRGIPSDDQLAGLNLFVKEILDRVSVLKGITRSTPEILRF
ncbi:hypothetical protein Indivirus_1_106 [Indivirus ILV1]|uniref:Uncharacterized protein n=1 Tax=Indivirus ILV1 TaxID=1977633 RepID=A0A1V0SCP1_9VIRU|nr:hypothetical protein Indivirus_1_106 [Indivirus ILV1]